MNSSVPCPAHRVLLVFVVTSILLTALVIFAGPAFAATTTPTPAPVTATTAPTGPVATIGSAVANIRGGPGTGYPLLGQAKRGAAPDHRQERGQLMVAGRFQGQARLDRRRPGASRVRHRASQSLGCPAFATRYPPQSLCLRPRPPWPDRRCRPIRRRSRWARA